MMASEPNWPQSSLPQVTISSHENPPWTGWDVLFIALTFFASFLLCLIAVTLVVRRVGYPSAPFMEVMAFPLVAFGAQMCAYVITLAFMFVTVAQKSSIRFGSAVRWNWPSKWLTYIALGIAFAVGLQFLAQVLPMPKDNEMEVFFQTPLRAWVLSIFAITFVPLMEELFFRGFLYPVLERRLGVIVAVLLTTLAFAGIHEPQLADPHVPWANSIGAVLLIFIIGLALTIVRVVKKSVGAGVLMHMGYNGLTAVAAIIQTGGFRHLDRLSR